jgi:ankyrin repeat protein
MSRDEFIEAIRKGDSPRVREMSDRDPSLLARSGDGPSPILQALYNGRGEVAALLAERTPDRTVHEAAALGEVDRVRAMVKADPLLVHSFSPDGYAVFGFGTFFRHPEVDRALLALGPDVNAQARNPQRVGAIHAAAAQSDREMVRTLLEHGANPNLKQQLDYTPLHTAAGRGDIEMAKLLIRHGADASVRGTDGKTLLDVAREHGQVAFEHWFRELTEV